MRVATTCRGIPQRGNLICAVGCAFVDWCISHPISSPATVLQISKVVTDEKEQFGLLKDFVYFRRRKSKCFFGS